MTTGVAGGLLYEAVRPSLTRLGRWHGLVFGLLPLAIFGPTVIESGNRDFGLFASPAINVLLFVTLFPLFGLLITPLANRLDQGLPEIPPASPVDLRARAGYVLIGLVAFLTLGLLVPALFALFVFVGGPRYAALFLYIVVALPVMRLIFASPERGGESDVLGLVRYTVAGAPVLAGLVLTSRTFADVLGV